MLPDDLTIDAPLRAGKSLSHPAEIDVPLAQGPSRFLRAIVIGVPIAVTMWGGIGFAIFRAFFRR